MAVINNPFRAVVAVPHELASEVFIRPGTAHEKSRRVWGSTASNGASANACQQGTCPLQPYGFTVAILESLAL